MGFLSRLFGNGDGDGGGAVAAAAALGQARIACPECERQILPGSHCPFCQSQAFSKQLCDTLAREHAPQQKLEALGGVIVAIEAARQYGARGYLYVFQGKDRGQTVLLASEPVSVGRDAKANQLGLNDGNVSARHCEIRPAGEGFEIVDLDAKNGTFLNEAAVTRTALANGDVIALGDTRIYLGIT